ncbi:MAG: GGDEF domain-containing protein [Caulobacterales bacterium]
MKISGASSEPFSAIRRRSLAEAGARAVAAAPAVDQAQFLGISETELTPAVRAAIALLAIELDDLRAEVARLKARLLDAEAAADKDSLTCANNRRAFIRELKRVAAFSQRYGGPASLIYFDLDGLKAVNDRFGHAAGDAALQAVAQRLSANVRESDVVGRMGGDEFAVLLAQADLATARSKAEALARVIESEPVQCGEWMAPLHVSYGVRQVDPAVDAETLVAEADAAMFVMKRTRSSS